MPRSLRVRADYIGTVKRSLKNRGFLSQRALSEELRLALSTVSNFLNGRSVDRAVFEEICSRLDLNWQDIAAPIAEELSENELPNANQTPLVQTFASVAPKPSYRDWGEAPKHSVFYGRTDELATLDQWIVHDQCRLVFITGMGGIGKTALSVALSEQVCDRVDFLIWRSLRNAPRLSTLLTDISLSLSHQQEMVSNRLDEQLSWLLNFFSQHRCLLVLDNGESILQAGEPGGHYREGYEPYHELFERVINGRHQSCVVLTSREQPPRLTRHIGDTTHVRSLILQGLPMTDGKHLLAARSITGANHAIEQLINTYRGNPLALTIAAATIRSTLGGDVNEFLQQEIVAYGDIWDLLSQQFERLSPVEQQVMYWLAIEREWVTLKALHDAWMPSLAKRNLLEALESLQQRSLIDVSDMGFTQQPVVMEYVTQKLIDACHQEIVTQQFALLKSHALLKAQTQDYIRDTQRRLILHPLAQKLLITLTGKISVDFLLNQLLDSLRGKPSSYVGYAAGNILNLLNTLQLDLSDRDFSELVIIQAYLPNATLHRTNFAWSTIHQSAFAETMGGIVAVAFSKDGEWLAASDTCGEIHVWQAHTRQKTLTLKGHHSWVFSLVFSPNSTSLASASDDYVVKLWDLMTGECLQTLKGPANILNAVTFSADERKILVDNTNTKLQLWAMEHPEQHIAAWHGYIYLPRSTAYSPDGKTIAISTHHQTIKLWNVETGECEKVLDVPTPTVRLIAFSSDGQRLASASSTSTIQVWDLSSDQCIYTLKGHSQSISELTFSPDNCWLASSSFDQTIKLWDLATGECLKTLYGHHKKLMAIAFSPDGQQLVSGGDDHTVKLWDLHTGQCITTFQGYTNAIPAIALSPNGHTLASAHEDRTVKLWDLHSGHVVKTLSNHEELVWTVAFSPTGDRLVSASADRTINFWNLNTGICTTSFGHSHWVRSATFHPNGHSVATGSYDGTIKLWDTQTGSCLQTLSGHTSAVLWVCFSPDGRTLASSSFDQTIRLWDVDTGAGLHMLHGHSDRIWQVVFSGDGQWLASCSQDQTIKLWQLQTGQCFRTLTGHQGAITSVHVSPDDQSLVSGSFDQTVKRWDIRTGQCLQTYRGHTSAVLSVLFACIDDWENGKLDSRDNGDRTSIMSSSLDGTIKFWDVDSATCWKTLRTPRPYEDMNITGIVGLTDAQRSSLKALGAIEYE
jgi:WD40 repeat protein